MKFLTDLFTCPDNVTWDLVRIAVGVASVFAMSAQVVAVFKTGTFDASQFGMGMAAIIGAGAAGMWARKDIEVLPEHKHEEKKPCSE